MAFQINETTAETKPKPPPTLLPPKPPTIPQPPPPPTPPRTVTVQNGDTLNSIAEDNNTPFNALLENNLGITSIYTGMFLNIPGTNPLYQKLNPLLQQSGLDTGDRGFNYPSAGQQTQPERFADRAFDILADNPNRYAGSVVDDGQITYPSGAVEDIRAPFQSAGINIPDFEMQEGRRITAEGRNLAGSRFNDDPITGFQDPNLDVGVQRQGVIDIINNMMGGEFVLGDSGEIEFERAMENGKPVEGKYLQQISSLVVPTLFSEMSALEIQYGMEKGELLNDMAGVYDIDALGNLVQKGTAPTDGGTGGAGSGGYYGGGGYRGSGGSYGGGVSGAGGQISSNMLTWRVATG